MRKRFIFIFSNFLWLMLPSYFEAASLDADSSIVASPRFHSFKVHRNALEAVNLGEYFTDCFVEVEDTDAHDHHVSLKLHFPATADFFIDPRLYEGLAFFCGGLPSLCQIPYQVKRDGVVLETLNDNWTLWGWSQWYSRNHMSFTDETTLTILHFDDHTDFMSPRIHIVESEMYDSLTGKPINLLDPDSVASAICSTGIGIGSFIAPFLWQLNSKIKNVKILHVSQRYSKELEFFQIVLSSKQQHFPQRDLQRLELNLVPIERLLGKDIEYVRTSSLATVLPCISARDRILVHFDLDCFNNRYDRDSDWTEKETTHDPSLKEVSREIDTVCGLLNTEIGRKRLEDISIAYCPGFFPAELWETSREILMSYFKEER